MGDRKKIKDIYNCKYIISDKELYPLQKWYNQLIDKTISEINIADVLRMIRQKEMIDLAISKAMDFLRNDVFAGETYEGELLEKLSEVEDASLLPYFDELKEILSHTLEEERKHEWLCDEEKEEFEKIVSCISNKII